MAKIIKCKTCNAEIASSAKRCPSCGAKNKKPIYKRPWFIVAILLVIIIAIASSGGNDSTTSDDIEPTISQEDNIKETDKAKESKDVPLKSYESVKNETLAILEKHYGSYGEIKILEDEESGTVMFAIPTPDEFVEAVVAINTGIGHDELIGPYEEMKESFINLSKSTYLLGQTCGKTFYISLQNSQNPDKVLLTVLNGVVVQETAQY